MPTPRERSPSRAPSAPRSLGERAIRFARPAGPSPRALVRELRSWPGVIDVVVARDDIALYFDAPFALDEARLAALESLADTGEPAREIELDAQYTGPDLDEVARATGLSTAEVIAAHASHVYGVELMGFAPGFAYLTGVDPRLALPRLATPRPRVPAGSLAIAAGYTAVYPFDSPGGWHLIGSVATRMFGAEGALLRLGDRVHFRAAR